MVGGKPGVEVVWRIDAGTIQLAFFFWRLRLSLRLSSVFNLSLVSMSASMCPSLPRCLLVLVL